VLGAASYSCYLIHPIALSAFGQVWSRLLPTNMAGLVSFSMLAVIGCCAAGIVLYVMMEAPLVRLQRLRRKSTSPEPLRLRPALRAVIALTSTWDKRAMIAPNTQRRGPRRSSRHRAEA